MSSNKYGSNLRNTTRVASKQAMGEFGKEILGGANLSTTAETVFRQIYVISECEISDIEDDDAPADQVDVLTSEVVPAGTILFGRFHNITITSGIVVCYKEGPPSGVFNPMTGR